MVNEKVIAAQVKDLFDNIKFTAKPEGLYDPLRYMIEIGGKRLRPTLCLTAYSMFKNELGPEVFEPAVALEVFHSFTLLHDDIMDKSPLRRGKETVWKKWNEDTAILSGDVMLIDAYKRMAKAPAQVLDRAMDLFSTTAAEVCEGQQYDMEFETMPEVSMAEYEKMIGLKTAVLIACSAKMGALVSGATDAECEALYRYGYEIGMAFQVADDYLDAFGDEKVFGKPIGGDILNEKKSWLTVRAMQLAPDKKAFMEAFTAKAETPEGRQAKISRVKSIYNDLAVPEAAKAEIVRYSRRAMDAVSGIGLKPECVEVLRNFAEKLVGRAK